MTAAMRYAVLTESQLPEAARLLHHAFAGAIESCEMWQREIGLENQRALFDPATPDHPQACLTYVPMGQYFGGSSVRMLGIAGVAVAPEARGRGLARTLMSESVREAYREGWPLCGLYASTQSLYRAVGYEQSGFRFMINIAAHRIASRGWSNDPESRQISVRSITDADEQIMRECYKHFAMQFDGLLDRGPYCWGRVRKMRDLPYRGFGFFSRQGVLEGYVFISQVRDPRTGRHDVRTTDLVFITPRAGRAIAHFLADFATTADSVTFFGGPLHPLLTLLPQQHYEVTKLDYWMLRVSHVEKALHDRAYAMSTTASIELELEDDLLPDNAGVWQLAVERGKPKVSRTAASTGDVQRIKLHIRALAPLYSGLYSARQLAMLGMIEGELSALATADAIFGNSRTPWMIDMF